MYSNGVVQYHERQFECIQKSAALFASFFDFMRLWMSFRCVYYIMPLYLVCVRARLFRMSFHYVAAGEKPLSNALTIQTVVGLFGSVPSGTIFAYI